MTPDQQAEWDYRYTERLALLCGDGKPTPKQIELAKEEADFAVFQLG